MVLVTGGGAGIGRACAHRLAAEGALVAVGDVDRESAERTVAELDEAADHLALHMDVTDRASVDAAVAGSSRRPDGSTRSSRWPAGTWRIPAWTRPRTRCGGRCSTSTSSAPSGPAGRRSRT